MNTKQLVAVIRELQARVDRIEKYVDMESGESAEAPAEAPTVEDPGGVFEESKE